MNQFNSKQLNVLPSKLFCPFFPRFLTFINISILVFFLILPLFSHESIYNFFLQGRRFKPNHGWWWWRGSPTPYHHETAADRR